MGAVISSDVLTGRTAVRVGGVNRVAENVMDCVVDGRPPFQTSAFQAMAGGRQHDLLLQKPEKNLPCALQLGELAEDQGERILHSKVWILFYLIKPFAYIANRHCRE